ncbi:methyltransferase [Thermogladius sp. 4427co]|uniref:methyltransferase n=1 Tax=Thermogladius sp. 4427co TaxID=3450718 RepID=UPI003F790917
MIDRLSEIRGRQGFNLCVDIGSGTGFLGLYMLRKELCRRVVFIDVYEKPLSNTVFNIRLNRLEHKSIVLADTKGLGDSTVELVVSNPPYLPGVPGDGFEASIYTGPLGYEVILEILEEACRILVDRGLMILVYSTLSNTGVIEESVRKCFTIKISESRSFFYEEIKSVLLEKSGRIDS